MPAPPTLSDIEAILSRTDWGGYQPCSLAILRNITVEPMLPYLRFQAMQRGIHLEALTGDFDNVVQEALHDTSLVHKNSAVLVILDLEGLAPACCHDFATLSQADLEHERQRIVTLCRSVAAGIRRKTGGPLLWLDFALPRHPAYGAADHFLPVGQGAYVSELNRQVGREVREAAGALLVDLNRCVREVGMEQFYDDRLKYAVGAPWTLAGSARVADEVVRLLAAALGKNKKCLVLDCDNTLWGGVVGEVGLDGIALGPSYPGRAYVALQRAAKNLAVRGVILAVNSRNNPEDVMEVFRHHPHMVLKEEEIAAWSISWEDKVRGMRHLADQLNIGLDAMVLVDDSPFEIEMVRAALPEVATIQLDKEKPYTHATLVAGSGLFDTVVLSNEDRERGRMYRAEAGRRRLQEQALSLTEYLAGLDLTTVVRPAEPADIPRLAQLCQRTNQFNLTTRRHSEEVLQGFLESDGWDVLGLSLTDRFGDYGTVGLAILEHGAGESLLDTFLLSCRALGRGVETVLLAAILEQCRKRGVGTLRAQRLPTRKNAPTAHFLPAHGFARVATEGEEARVEEFRRTTAADLDLPPHIHWHGSTLLDHKK